MALVVCWACSRHVRETEPQCPFCHHGFEPRAARSPRASEHLGPFAAVALAAASLSTSHCKKDPPDTSVVASPTTAVQTANEAPSSAPAGASAGAPNGAGSAVPDEAIALGGPITSATPQRSEILPGRAAVYGAPPVPEGATVAVGPRGNATIGAIQTKGGEPPNAQRVVAGMRAGFRACYNRGLRSDPLLAGRVQLTIQVDATGVVTNATATSDNPNLERSAITACIRARARAARFEVSGNPATITTEVTLAILKVD